jgi:hypothetical protein
MNRPVGVQALACPGSLKAGLQPFGTRLGLWLRCASTRWRSMLRMNRSAAIPVPRLNAQNQFRGILSLSRRGKTEAPPHPAPQERRCAAARRCPANCRLSSRDSVSAFGGEYRLACSSACWIACTPNTPPTRATCSSNSASSCPRRRQRRTRTLPRATGRFEMFGPGHEPGRICPGHCAVRFWIALYVPGSVNWRGD